MRWHLSGAPVTGAALFDALRQLVGSVGLPGILFRDLAISRTNHIVVRGMTGGAVACFCELFTTLRVASLQSRASPGTCLNPWCGEHRDDGQREAANAAVAQGFRIPCILTASRLTWANWRH